MTRADRRAGFAGITVLLSAGVLHAQGRGWTTNQGDAQRSGWIRTDAKVSVEAMQKPGFQLLWKTVLDSQARQLQNLTQPVTLPNIISYKGFKALAFVGGASDTVFSIDYELNRMFWTRHLSTTAPMPAGTLACAGGLTTITRYTAVVPAAVGGRGFGSGAAAPSAGGGGAGRGRAAPGGQPPEAGAPMPAAGAPGGAAAAGGRGRGGGGGGAGFGGGRGMGNNTIAVGSSGMVYLLNPQTGEDTAAPVKFLPANVAASGAILIDNTVYAATVGHCGGSADGVYAVDLTPASGSPVMSVVSWTAGGAPIAGTAGPAFGADGTVYVATGSGSGTANTVVALDGKTLAVDDSFTSSTPFTSSPVVFAYKGRDYVAVTNRDGKLYLLDSKAMAQAPVMSAPYASGTFAANALASWEDASGTRWILVPSGGASNAGSGFSANGAITNGAVLAFKVVDQEGKPALQPAWASRDLISPVAPIVMNGVVFALSTGEFRGAGTASQAAQRSTPAVLYALDGISGKEYWNSGRTMTSFVHGVSPSGSDSQIYVATYDGTLYAFGMPMER